MGKKVYIGGAFAGVAAIIASWVAIGTGGGAPSITTCPLPAYPSASCTGVPSGTSLTVVNTHPYDVNTTNAVVDALDVNGCIVVHAPGVTIKNSRVQCIAVLDAAANPNNAPLTIQDTEINCKYHQTGGVGEGTGIRYQNYIVERANIHGCDNGLDMFKDDKIQDSYIHDLTQCANHDCTEPDPPHTDGIQSGDGSNVSIIHNTIYGFTPPCPDPNDGSCNGTSAINVNHNSSGGPTTTNLIIRNNLLAGGGNSLYCPTPNTPVSSGVTNNQFSTVLSDHIGAFAPSTGCSTMPQSGNVIHETGDPIRQYGTTGDLGLQ